jgi:quinol-cytochrome oxidoreductase complex cytochrome b subunit
MEETGKFLIYTGVFLIIAGILIIGISKFGSSIPIGKLPGDIYIKKDNFVFYFPLGTSILISLLLFFFTFFLFLLARKQ